MVYCNVLLIKGYLKLFRNTICNIVITTEHFLQIMSKIFNALPWHRGPYYGRRYIQLEVVQGLLSNPRIPYRMARSLVFRQGDILVQDLVPPPWLLPYSSLRLAS